MKKKKFLYIGIIVVIMVIIIVILIRRNISKIEEESISGWNEEELVNVPKLSEGMSPIIYNESGDAVIVDNNEDWYCYQKQEGRTENGGSSRWANAQTKDGSKWVWIPRFAYKINYVDSENKEKGGTINVKFLKGNTNLDSDNNDVTKQGYIVHPAFRNGEKRGYTNGEWDEEIVGIWVSKFEAGFAGVENTASSDIEAQDTEVIHKVTSGENIYGKIEMGKTKMKYPVFVGGAFSYSGIDIGEMYILCQNLNAVNNPYGVNKESEDIHLMKNSEWGAVAYLAYSAYGRNATPISINNVAVTNVNTIETITGYSSKSDDYSTNYIEYSGNLGNYNDKSFIWYSKEGGLASTTGNEYGVFDMSGGATEYVAGYLDNMEMENEAYKNDFGDETQSNKYFTIFKYEEGKATYESNKNIYGDATIETSSGNGTYESWDGETSYYLTRKSPFFLRGGTFSEGEFAGLFSYSIHSGHSGGDHGFRCTLIIE